ncbi:hypothetical protein [Microbacterium maritypicum]
MITSSDFRYVDSPRFWRFTFEQTEDLLQRVSRCFVDQREWT